jgi:chromosome segregation ATPase
MFWIVPVALGVGLLSLLANSSERAARKRLARKYDKADRELRWHNERVRSHLQDKQQNLDFKQKIDAHYASHLAGSAAFAVYLDAKTSYQAIKQIIHDLKSQKEVLKQHLDAVDAKARDDIFAQIRAINETLTQLFDDFNLVRQQRDNLKQQVYTLNQQTAQLKLQIRDQCGEGGRHWFSRLEQKKQLKVVH